MISSVFPGEIPGRSRLALLGRRGFPLRGASQERLIVVLLPKSTFFTTAATQFNNLLDATFQKSTGAGTTTISVAYDNAGTVLNTSDGILTFTNCVGCPP